MWKFLTIKCIKVFLAGFLIIIFSCTKQQDVLIFDNQTIVHDSLKKENFIVDFLTVSDYFVFILSDPQCSTCLRELKYWNTCLKNFKELKQVFIVNTHYPDIFIFYCETKNYNEAIIWQSDLYISMLNKFSAKDKIIITDNKLNIIFKDSNIDSIKLNSIYKKYKIQKVPSQI